MKKRKKKIYHILLMLALSTALPPCYGQNIENKVTPAEMQNAKALSQAYLRAKAHKKQRVIDDTKVDRDRLQSIISALDELKLDVNTKFSSYTLSQGAIIISTSEDGKVSSKSKGKNKKSDSKEKKVDALIQKLETVQQEIKGEMPSDIFFWKGKSKNEKRKLRVADKLQEVENALNKPEGYSEIELSTLSKKLTISKNISSKKENTQAIKRFTGEIKRAPLPVNVSERTGK